MLTQPQGIPFNRFKSRQLRHIRDESPYGEMVLASVDRLYVLACEARLYVVPGDTCAEDRNHRKMLVGSSALVRLESGYFEWVTGYNTKRTPQKNCPTKMCAEKRLIAKVGRMNTDNPVDYIVAMMTVGDFQPDDETGDDHDALDLCGACKRMCVRSKFTIPETLVFTANPPAEDGCPLFAEMRTIEYYDRMYVRSH